MDIFLQLLITGILVGSIYALVALGWTLIYKCSGVLNLAMGELTLIGAYVALTYYHWGFPFLVAVPAMLITVFTPVSAIQNAFLVFRVQHLNPTVINITKAVSFFFRAV